MTIVYFYVWRDASVTKRRARGSDMTESEDGTLRDYTRDLRGQALGQATGGRGRRALTR